MNMRKLIIAATLLLIGAGHAWACGPEQPNYDAYVFRLCKSPQSYSEKNDQRLADAWSALVGRKVTVAQSRQLANVMPDELDTLDNPIMRYARQNKEVDEYVRLLVSYIQTANFTNEGWGYPTREEMDAYRSNLKSLLAETQQYKGKLLADRYYLLRLRILFRQVDYQGVIDLWEKQPMQGGSVFADMARDLYAGALYHVGRQEDAAVQYALSGNMYDAHQCMKNMHGAQCLKRVVESDPNSPVLPYMLEELVNGCRESFNYHNRVEILRAYMDASPCLPWQKVSELQVPYMCVDFDDCCPDDHMRLTHLPSMEEWFSLVHIFKVNKDEEQVLDAIIEQQLANPKVKDRCMWLSAKAYLQYVRGNYDQAWQHIQQAAKMDGSAYSTLNARYLLMLFSTRQPSLKVMESTLVKGLPEFLRGEDINSWSHTSADGSFTYYDFESHVVDNRMCLNHLVCYGIADRYLREGDSVMATMVWSLLNYKYDDEEPTLLPSAGLEHYNMLCQLSPELQQQLIEKLRQPASKQGELLHMICKRLPFEMADYYDVVGTLLIRRGRFAEAIPLLEKVPLKFLSRQHIAPYAVARSIRDLPWERRDINEFDGSIKITSNAKIDYCREVLALQKHMKNASGEDLRIAAYNLGALYHQASVMGSCWWLAHYYVSTNYEYNLSLDEGYFDFVKHSRELLLSALDSKSADLRYKTYFLLLQQGREGLIQHQWTEDYSECNAVLNTQSEYYPVLCRFKTDLYGRPNMPDFVSNCDDLTTMYKMMR